MRISSSLPYFLLVTFAITDSSSLLGENHRGLKNEEEESLIASQRSLIASQDDKIYDMENEIEELKDKLFILYNPDKEGSNTEEEDTTPLQSVVKDPMSLEEKGEKESTDYDDLMVARSEDVVIISNVLKNVQNGTRKFNRRSSGGKSKYPVDGKFHLLQGYSLTGPYASPFKPIVKKCIDGKLDACEENVAPSDKTNYLSKAITSVKEMNSFTEAVVKVEGSYMGVSGSGSVGVMANSRVNSKSVSHIIHNSLYSKVTNVRNFSELKLNEVAKRLLEKDPEKFLKLYGFNFVSQITYGGSFLGYFSLSTKTEESQQSLELEATASYTNGFFSAEGSAEFTNRMSENNMELTVTSGFGAKPAFSCPTINTPKNLGDCYDEWNDAALSDRAAPLFLQLSSYAVSQDVQDIITADDWIGDIDLFITPAMSPRTLPKVAQERLNTELLIKTLTMYLADYKTVQHDIPHGINKSVRDLLSNAREYRNNLVDKFSDAQLYLLNHQLVETVRTNDKINNRFKSWLYYEQTLQKEAELLRISRSIELEGARLQGRKPGGPWIKSEFTDDYVANKAIDGDLTTFAHSGAYIIGGQWYPHINAYLEITFQVAEIHTIEFFNRADWRKEIELQRRWDNLYVEILNGNKSVWRVDLWDSGSSSPRNLNGKEYFKLSSPKIGDTLRIGQADPIGSDRDSRNYLGVAGVNINGWILP